MRSVRFAAMLSLSLILSGIIPQLSGASSDAPVPVPATTDNHTFRISPVERTGAGRYRLGEIEVNKSEKTVSFPAELNMERGMLEYLLVRYGGKTHESLLRTRIEPFNLQLACLLLDIEGTSAPLAAQGSPETPTGDPVEIVLKLKDGRTVATEQWMSRIVDGVKQDPPPLKWVFTGSRIGNGRFAAQVTGSMVAVYHDPVAMIDNASPGGGTNGGWVVKEGAVPPVGTPVTVVIRSLK